MSSLQASSTLNQCKDDNPKVWKHVVEINDVKESLASCSYHKEELHKTGIKIISEESIK